MKNLMFATLAATVLASSVGCCCGNGGLLQPWGCSNGCGCSSGGCGIGGCSSGGCGCSSGGCSSGGCSTGGCSSCGSGGSGGCNDCAYSSRFGTSGGGNTTFGASRYWTGGPPTGALWLSNTGCANNCNHRQVGPGFGLAPCGCAKNHNCKYQQREAPPMTAMQYPYYQTRGPRDFLAKNPANIGP